MHSSSGVLRRGLGRISGRVAPAFLIGLAAAPRAARADFFTTAWQTHHEEVHELSLGIDFDYYNTSQNFDSGGNLVLPNGFSRADRQDARIRGVFGVSPEVTLYGVMDWRRAEVVAPTSTSTYAGVSYGLGDQAVGVNYRLYHRSTGRFSIDLQAQLDFPGYANNSTSVSPYLGDATVDGTGGIFMNIPLYDSRQSESFIHLGAGYTYRSSGFSSDVPWSLFIDFKPKSEGLLFSAGAFGIESLKTDANTNSATASSVAGLGSDTSFVTNAINPTLVSATLEAGYRFKSGYEITIFGADGFYGQNAPQGVTFGAGLAYHWGSPDTSKRPAAQTPFEYRKSNKGFVSYDIEARILRTNDRFNLIKIDRGADGGVHVGEVFDIFTVNTDGSTGSAIARGSVTDVKSEEAALRIDEYFKEVWIEQGYVARRVIH